MVQHTARDHRYHEEQDEPCPGTDLYHLGELLTQRAGEVVIEPEVPIKPELLVLRLDKLPTECGILRLGDCSMLLMAQTGLHLVCASVVVRTVVIGGQTAHDVVLTRSALVQLFPALNLPVAEQDEDAALQQE